MKCLSLRFVRLCGELAVLFGLYAAGCLMARWSGWPLPGGVIGLALLLLAFASGRVSPQALKLGAGLLLSEMLLFFIPALMSLLDYGELVREDGWRILLVIGTSTLLVMLSTALAVELLCRWRTR
nr:murein hydrolase regulator LrgA [Gammaproteobacteria bacterium]